MEEIPYAPADTDEAGKNLLQKENKAFQTKWEKEIAKGDPYYNPNFSLKYLDYTLKVVKD